MSKREYQVTIQWCSWVINGPLCSPGPVSELTYVWKADNAEKARLAVIREHCRTKRITRDQIISNTVQPL